MKNLFLVCTLLFSFNLFGQEYTTTIKKELRFAQSSPENVLSISNVNGQVEVEGYNGSSIQVEVKMTISADTQAKLEEGKKEIELGIYEEANEIFLYTKTPCAKDVPSRNKKGKWQWSTNHDNCNWDFGYHYLLHFKVKVPKQINLNASTVNQGDVIVKNVSGKLDANNINGSIMLDQISGKTKAHSINGDIDLKYTKNPTQNSRYYTLNGDINAFFQKGLNAKMLFESYNGDFYTNLDDVKMLPSPIKKKVKGKGISYKVGSKSIMQVGSGSVELDFETFNGNVYVKEM